MSAPTTSYLEPPLVLRPESDRQPLRFVDLPAEVQQAELDRVHAETAVEKKWYKDRADLLLPDKAAVLRAIGQGALALVPFENDSRFSPVFGDFFNRQSTPQIRALPETDSANEVSVPYLRPHVLEVLTDLCSDAHAEARRRNDVQEQMQQAGIRRFQFAITSMARTVLYQMFIAQNGGLAVMPEAEVNSSHSYGGAFDFDHSGHYAEQNSGERLSCGIGRREGLFLPGAIEALADTLEWYVSAGDVSAICEVPQARGCYHVAVPPQ